MGDKSMKNPLSRRGVFGLIAGLGASELFRNAAEAAPLPEGQVLDAAGTVIPAKPYLEPAREFLRQISDRPNLGFDYFNIKAMNRLSIYISKFANLTCEAELAEQGDSSRFDNPEHAPYEYTAVHLNRAVQALSYVYFLRGLDADHQKVICDAIDVKRGMSKTDLPVFLKGVAETLPLVMSDSNDLETIDSDKYAYLSSIYHSAEQIPDSVLQSDDSKADLNAWLDKQEQKVYDLIPSFEYIHMNRWAVRDSIDAGAQNGEHMHVTKRNLQILAMQTLLFNMRRGFRGHERLEGIIDNPNHTYDDDGHTIRVAQKYQLENFDFSEANAADAQYHVKARDISYGLSVGMTPFEISISDEPQKGLDVMVERTFDQLDRVAARDYASFKRRMAVAMALRGPNLDDPYYKQDDVEPPAAEDADDAFQPAEMTEKIISAVSTVQSVLSVLGIDAIRDGWQETADEEAAVMQEVILPEDQSVDHVAAALENQPASVFEIDGRVVVILDDVEDAELVPVPGDALEQS